MILTRGTKAYVRWPKSAIPTSIFQLSTSIQRGGRARYIPVHRHTIKCHSNFHLPTSIFHLPTFNFNTARWTSAVYTSSYVCIYRCIYQWIPRLSIVCIIILKLDNGDGSWKLEDGSWNGTFRPPYIRYPCSYSP